MAERREGLAIWPQGGAGLGLEKEISSHSGLLRFPAVATPPTCPTATGSPVGRFLLLCCKQEETRECLCAGHLDSAKVDGEGGLSS